MQQGFGKFHATGCGFVTGGSLLSGMQSLRVAYSPGAGICTCTCIYIYIYTHIFLRVHIYIYRYIHVHLHSYWYYIYVHACIIASFYTYNMCMYVRMLHIMHVHLVPLCGVRAQLLLAQHRTQTMRIKGMTLLQAEIERQSL